MFLKKVCTRKKFATTAALRAEDSGNHASKYWPYPRIIVSTLNAFSAFPDPKSAAEIAETGVDLYLCSASLQHASVNLLAASSMEDLIVACKSKADGIPNRAKYAFSQNSLSGSERFGSAARSLVGKKRILPSNSKEPLSSGMVEPVSLVTSPETIASFQSSFTGIDC